MAFAAAALALLFGSANAQPLQFSLNPSNHNGFNVSCYGAADGAIDLTVSGGTPPYSYDWSTGTNAQDVTDLRQGFISVIVRDSQSGLVREELTLTEPNKLEAVVAPYLYASGSNISCVSCYNGSIQVTTTEGVAPYSYAWDDGPTTEDRTQLDAGSYRVIITDANGCLLKGSTLLLTQPERDDWGKAGNAGTDPNTQFLGTTDNKNVVFKSNGAERIRLKSDGTIQFVGLQGPGILRAGGGGVLELHPEIPEPGRRYPYWTTSGNDLSNGNYPEWLGTIDEEDLRVKTNSIERMRITSTGKVGIGTTPPWGAINGYRLFVEDGIVTRDVLVTANNFPDFVFDAGYTLMPLDELKKYIHINGHLPNFPSAAEVKAKEGVEVGDLQLRLLRTVEEQQLYILTLHDELTDLKVRLAAIENARR